MRFGKQQTGLGPLAEQYRAPDHQMGTRTEATAGVVPARLLLRITSDKDAEIAPRKLASDPYPSPSSLVEWLARKEASAGGVGRRLARPLSGPSVAIGPIFALVKLGDLALPTIG